MAQNQQTARYWQHGDDGDHTAERVSLLELRSRLRLCRRELQERNGGERPHSALQFILTALFNPRRREWKAIELQEQRVQVKEMRFRIPDVCVLRRSDPADNVVHLPPLVCIEILSPEDRWQRILERVRDYHQMGVEHVWIFDPFSHDAWIAQPDGTQQHVSDALSVAGTPIRIDLAEVWAELDEMQSPQ